MRITLVLPSGDPTDWDGALLAFLAEKQRRTGSRRTSVSYARMLFHVFGRTNKTPNQVTGPDVFAWAYGRGLSGREPSATTIGARIACLSSFYRFLIRMGAVTPHLCDALERPKPTPAPPHELTGDDIRRLLAVIPDTRVGRRDQAIILTLTLTGRRRSEVMGLRAGDLSLEGSRVFYEVRGKGGKQGRKGVATMRAADSLWPGPNGGGITSGTFYTNLRRYLRAAGLPPVRRPHLPALGRQAAPRRGGIRRGREQVPGSLFVGPHDDILAAAGRCRGPWLGEGGGGDWSVSRPEGSRAEKFFRLPDANREPTRANRHKQRRMKPLEYRPVSRPK